MFVQLRVDVSKQLLQMLEWSQSIRNQESAVQPDHLGSGRKDPIQGDATDHKLVEFSKSSTVFYRKRRRGWKRKEETLLKTLEFKGNNSSNNILKD